MRTGWVIDLQHYLAPSGAIADLPAPARRLAEYFASIVVDATSNIDDPPSVRCRRRCAVLSMRRGVPAGTSVSRRSLGSTDIQSVELCPVLTQARKRCPGIIYSVPSLEDLEAIDWHCPECGDYGVIRGWEGTLWDGFADAESRALS